MAFNIKKAKEIKRKHPNKKRTDCIKEAGVLGAVKKRSTKVGTVKKRKSVAGVKRKIAGVAKKKIGAKPAGTLSGLSKNLKIVDTINSMESKYKNTRDPLKKKVLAVAINKEHDKLDRIFKK